MDKVKAHKAQLRFRKIFFKKQALVMILIFPNLNLEESYHKRGNKNVQQHIQEPFSMMSDSQKKGLILIGRIMRHKFEEVGHKYNV